MEPRSKQTVLPQESINTSPAGELLRYHPICNSLDELLDNRILPKRAGLVERRRSVDVRHVWLRPAAHQAKNDVQHPPCGRIVKRCVAWGNGERVYNGDFTSKPSLRAGVEEGGGMMYDVRVGRVFLSSGLFKPRQRASVAMHVPSDLPSIALQSRLS